MFDWLVETFSAYPYVGVAVVFLLCGLGFPLPEEIVLLFAGYVCYSDLADTRVMSVVCVCAILVGDLIPFALGRIYGPRLLRIRLMRILVTPERLARFDRFFRRRGEFVVLISRFIAGIRVVSFFTAGTMKMSWTKFVLLDLAGIVPIASLLVWLGDRYGTAIEAVIDQVAKVERGILIASFATAAIVGVWYWLRWRRHQRLLVGGPAETFVEPSAPIRRDPTEETGDLGPDACDEQPGDGGDEPAVDADRPPPDAAGPAT